MPESERLGQSVASPRSVVTCPRCLRHRDRTQTLVTHVCVDHRDCARAIEAARNSYREALEWVTRRYEETLAGKSVRDADEALHHANLLLEGAPGA